MVSKKRAFIFGVCAPFLAFQCSAVTPRLRIGTTQSMPLKWACCHFIPLKLVLCLLANRNVTIVHMTLLCRSSAVRCDYVAKILVFAKRICLVTWCMLTYIESRNSWHSLHLAVVMILPRMVGNIA